jgi:hypothetical protein
MTLPRLALAIGLIAAGALAQSQLILVDIATQDETQMQALIEAGLDSCDIWDITDKAARAMVTPEQLRWLRARGLPVEELSTTEYAPLAEDGYLTFAEYEADMAAWDTTYPGHVSLTSIGTTWEGRNIRLLKISDNVGVDESEPEVMMISLQHAREWLSGMTLYGIAEHLITEYGTDPTVTDLVDNLEIYVILVANPDGYVYTHSTERFWRKNRRDNGDGTFGVDTNRNWPWAWQFSTNTSSNTYGGPAPKSEPETQALDAWVLGRGDDLVGFLNYHTFNTRVMHSWASTFDLPPNVDVMGPLARDIALAIEAVNGQRMRNGSWAITLNYVGAGATNDYIHAQLGIPCFTFELRPGDGASGGFAPTGASIAPSQSENIPGAILFLQWARDQAGDTTAPIIGDITVSRISNDTATISWTTDDPSSAFLHHGSTLAYGSSQEDSKLRDITHSVTLTGLSPATLHHAQIEAVNLAGLTSLSPDIPFTTSATSQDITPPQAPAIDTLRIVTPGVVEISWIVLEGGALTGHRLYESPNGDSWTLLLDEGTLTTASTSAQFTAPPSGQMRLYRLHNVDPALNESPPSDAYGLLTHGALAEALIVDGFDRWNSKPIAQSGNHTFSGDHALAVAAYGTSFDSCRNEMVGPTVDLQNYATVIWVLGDESTGNETFSAGEQAEVQTFLETGGNLFVSGSNIAYDLDRPSGPSVADRAFLNNYICADYVGDDIDDYDVNGTGGASIFGTDLIRFDEGSRGIYRVSDPDRVGPANGALAALESPTGEICAVQREGLFGGGSIPGRVVYLSFPFETIFPASERAAVMADVLTFFGASVPAEITGIFIR